MQSAAAPGSRLPTDRAAAMRSMRPAGIYRTAAAQLKTGSATPIDPKRRDSATNKRLVFFYPFHELVNNNDYGVV
jgi:hypothetical protein